PLVDHEDPPTDEELVTGWTRVLRELDGFASVRNRKVVLGELGYPRSRYAAVRPWSYGEDRDAESLALQERCLELALDAVNTSGTLVGAFLWKWFPGEVSRGNFTKSTPEMRAVIRRHWK
ncbi:MAG: hypothetical protein HKN12_07055, partial [Gemmatimonadetes bacterium]|nr:hypothetical protein [Gemmatimonadota bacterium]